MLDNIRITTLADNTCQGYGMLGEHGFSALVEAGDKKILLDTGASPHTVVHNAVNKGYRLSDLDSIILSHGHWDHTGGLESVLAAVGKEIPVYSHPDIWARKGVLDEKGLFSYVGIQYKRDNLEKLGAKFIDSSEPIWLSEDILLTGEEEMTTQFESVGQELVLELEDGSLTPDPLKDDQSLILRMERGLVIVLGCAHRGMINIIRHAMKLTGETKVHMVIGGTHLGPASDEQLLRTIESLKELGVERIGVSHCTGQHRAAVLFREFQDCFFFNNAGCSITI